MDILVTTTSKKSPGPTVRINCPLCHEKAVPAESFQQDDRIALFYLITIARLRNTFLTCTGCRKQLISKVGVDELKNYTPEDLSGLLVGRVSFVSSALAFISLAICWAPVVGTVTCIASIIVNRKTRGWRLTLSWIGLILNLLIIVLFVVVMVVESMRLSKINQGRM